jgi:two-component system sensor histidine kinase PilS (NtrC family)
MCDSGLGCLVDTQAREATKGVSMQEISGPVETIARTRLGWLLAARLLLAGISLALAVTIDRMDGGQSSPAIWGVYWTIVAAFVATIISALMVQRTRDPARFATLQVAIDVTIVTSLVYFSGGGESVFTFLYAIVVLYGALFLDRNGVGFSSGLAAAGYGFVLFGTQLGWLPSVGAESESRPLLLVGAYWGFYAGALLVLGMLANTLSAELRRTGAALDRQTTDLRRLRDLHLRTVESIGSGLLTTDKAGRVTSFNPEAERITGVTSVEAEGRLLDKLIPGAGVIFRSEGDTHLSGTSKRRNRLSFRNLREEELYLGIAASSLRDELGEHVGLVVIFQDVTEVVSMEHELRQSERLAAVGEMAARMAHEIRNPLASISGSVQVLQNVPEDAEVDPEHQRLMGIVVREVDRLNDLISDFLRYSRPAPMKPETVSLADICGEIAEMGRAQTSDELMLDLDLTSDVTVIADPAQLKAVVWNLWNNAIEAMEGVGRLSMRVSRLPRDLAQDPKRAGRNVEGAGMPSGLHSNELALLEIEDSGPGIAPHELERIFEPFFTTKRGGTGLGLATVLRLVEQHGGAIQVSNPSAGGTCVRVLLDCVERK